MRSPRSIQAGVISRLKVMADINIAERRVPQDGRISDEGRRPRHRPARRDAADGVRREGRHAHPRQGPGRAARSRISASCPRRTSRFESSYRKPYGTILVTGPTGSGKSTTLYATLNQLNTPDRNIITVEDPVEYRLPGINQVQINPKAGLTFAGALRSILRADPDIVLVGEIRDQETAIIGIEAALTGHLVLSTLHTNDAASTPMRLVEMGVEPFLVTQRARLRGRAAARPASCATSARSRTSRPRPSSSRPAGRRRTSSGEWPTLHRADRLRGRAGAPATGAGSASTR